MPFESSRVWSSGGEPSRVLLGFYRVFLYGRCRNQIVDRGSPWFSRGIEWIKKKMNKKLNDTQNVPSDWPTSGDGPMRGGVLEPRSPLFFCCCWKLRNQIKRMEWEIEYFFFLGLPSSSIGNWISESGLLFFILSSSSSSSSSSSCSSRFHRRRRQKNVIGIFFFNFIFFFGFALPTPEAVLFHGGKWLLWSTEKIFFLKDGYPWPSRYLCHQSLASHGKSGAGGCWLVDRPMVFFLHCQRFDGRWLAERIDGRYQKKILVRYFADLPSPPKKTLSVTRKMEADWSTAEPVKIDYFFVIDAV